MLRCGVLGAALVTRLDRPTPPSPSPSRARRSATALLAALLLAGSTGCLQVEYVAQAALGQIDLSTRKRGIDSAIGDLGVPPRTRRLLGEVAAIKAFAVKQGLTPTKSYTEFVDVGRPTVVTVVTAAPPLRLSLKTWYFPIVGSVPYLGWFDPTDAEDFAAELRRDGYDVDVRGSVAYSTLGWFGDPVLSSMIPEGDEAMGELVNTVVHESVHATVYVNGQTPLNESVASFVADRLTGPYLDERLGPGSRERAAYDKGRARRDKRALALHEAYKRVERLYASPLSREQKLAEKAKLLAQIRREIGFKRPINNATLAQSRAYNSGQAELDELLKACGGSYPRMLMAIKVLGEKAFTEQHQRDLGKVILPLAKGGCRG